MPAPLRLALHPAALACAFLTFALVALAQTPPASPPPDDHWACSALLHPDAEHHFLALADTRPPVAPVDGDDLLALVDRSPRFRLPAGYAPHDLVDIHTLRPSTGSQCTPPDRQCLRLDAALALRELMAAMRRDGDEAWLDSAFRSSNLQCGVFHMWAYAQRHGFCSATIASALPGHSQHQLGTAIDMFTHSWVQGGERFREGFGCSSGGRWLAARSWVFGFVLPYPLHPDYREPGTDCQPRDSAVGRIDPRTGYKYEPWHIRYVGTEAAAQFHAAWLASGPGTANEITLEQWLRAREHIADPIEPPVCEGCTCGACATFQSSVDAGVPCPHAALLLDPQGTVVPPAAPPTLVDVGVTRDETGTVLVRIVVDVRENTLTQPPIVNARTAIRFDSDATIQRLEVADGGVVHGYPALPDTWRVSVGIAGVTGDPWQAALVDASRDGDANGMNSRIPAAVGRVEVVVPVRGVSAGGALTASLMHAGDVVETRAVRAP